VYPIFVGILCIPRYTCTPQLHLYRVKVSRVETTDCAKKERLYWMGSNKSRRTLSRLSERCAVDGSSNKKTKKNYIRYFGMCVRGVDISVVVEVTRRVMRVYISAENLRRRETPRPARHRRVLGRYTNRGRRTGADRYY